MIDLNNISHLYFVGIGGIGMSALARFFKQNGKVVHGYDKTSTELTDTLHSEGFNISFEDSIEKLPAFAQSPNKNTLVVFTPAIQSDSKILNHFKNTGFQIVKRSEALALITANNFTIAVAGTHGKTSTTTYLAHILKSNNIGSASFLGGIASNYNTNYVSHKPSVNNIVVVEADEFDRSFLRLKPNISIITSCEADHLDIYENYNNLKQAYNDFANCTVKGGTLILHQSLFGLFDIRDDIKVQYYGENCNDIQIENIKVEKNAFWFDLNHFNLNNIKNGLPGKHNVLNATAAISAALNATKVADIKASLASFKGIKRRFEVVYNNHNCVYIDDYAHHPTEIKAAIETAKALYPKKPITVIFQPHLFTRTRDLAQGFKNALSMADEMIIMPIYPAREVPIKGITSQILKPKADTQILNHESVIQYIKQNKPKVLLTLGAGNIDKLTKPIAKILKTLANA
ncbi:MAG: UDP-N-acetylmuramate--L-alanine ligase [Bacteroidia bacterium]